MHHISRRISYSTVIKFLTEGILAGKAIKLKDLNVTNEIKITVMDAISKLSKDSFPSEIKRLCPPNITYDHINVVKAYLKVREHLKQLESNYDDFEECHNQDTPVFAVEENESNEVNNILNSFKEDVAGEEMITSLQLLQKNDNDNDKMDNNSCEHDHMNVSNLEFDFYNDESMEISDALNNLVDEIEKSVMNTENIVVDEYAHNTSQIVKNVKINQDHIESPPKKKIRGLGSLLNSPLRVLK